MTICETAKIRWCDRHRKHMTQEDVNAGNVVRYYNPPVINPTVTSWGKTVKYDFLCDDCYSSMYPDIIKEAALVQIASNAVEATEFRDKPAAITLIAQVLRLIDIAKRDCSGCGQRFHESEDSEMIRDYNLTSHGRVILDAQCVDCNEKIDEDNAVYLCADCVHTAYSNAKT